MITGPQIRAAREALGWSQTKLAVKAKVSMTVVQRAENSPNEPIVTIVQLNALLHALRHGGAVFSSAEGAIGGDEADP